MKLGYLTKTVYNSFKDVSSKKITGYFAHFNNEDSDGDTIIPGAFAKTIRERGPDSKQPRIKYLRNHLVYEPIGKLDTLKETPPGLYYEATPGSHMIGQDTVKMIESGLITEHSFGYDVIRKQVVDENADWANRKQILQELMMWEGSGLTGWGANELTGAATLKALGQKAYLDMLGNRQKALEKFCRNTTASDELIEALLLENKQLTQYIIDLSTDAEQSPPPDTKAKIQFSLLLN